MADLNILLPPGRMNNTPTPPPQMLDLLSTLSQNGFTVAAVSKIVHGLAIEADCCDFSPQGWAEAVHDSMPSSTQNSDNFRQKLSVVSRLTIKADEIQHMFPSSVILKSYDIVAVHVDSLRLFEAACERAPIDIISFECTQRPTFRISRKLIELALDRGITFEILYAPALQDPSTRRHIFSIASMLKSFVSDKAVILSSGACESGHIRNVYDVANLKAVLGLGKGSLPSNICDERIAQQVILHATARKMNGLGVHCKFFSVE